MTEYCGSCHCGGVTFRFVGPDIERGLRCNCSLCRRKGAAMTPFAVAPEDFSFDAGRDGLEVYRWGTEVARHYFCKVCGIYTFHETLRQPGHFRANLGCLEGIDPLALPIDVFDGASL
jgi:hypothetical protein